MNDADLTPLMRQYRKIKGAHADAILFFRVGDFYEMFFEDAQEASRLLAIALTSRDKARGEPIPLCGVPCHAATGYIAKLLKAGRTVALCEQVEDPKLAKGLVRREVVRLYTPGTLVDSELLLPGESNFLAAVTMDPAGPTLGLAALDLSTGEFWTAEGDARQGLTDLSDELSRLEPRELLYPAGALLDVQRLTAGLKDVRLCPREPALCEPTRGGAAHVRLEQLCGPAGTLTAGRRAAGAILAYLEETQPAAPLDHVKALIIKHLRHSMQLDPSTIRNLELVRPLSEDRRGPTLLSVLDRTVTAMGSRLLRQWIVRPLLDTGPIQSRLESVEELVRNVQARAGIRAALRTVQDIERLGARAALGLATPKELLALKASVAALPAIGVGLHGLRAPLLRDAHASWDDLADVHQLVEAAIHPDAPLSTRDGGLIKDGYHPDIDELRKTCQEGKTWIVQLEARERERTGIESLKVRYNQVFGYYIEVTKPNLAKVPGHYLRKQTLVNAERFTTEELQALEVRVTGAQVKLAGLEQDVFGLVRRRVGREIGRLQPMASVLATLDVLAALAETAAVNGYVRPQVDESGVIRIAEGRHPVVERLDLPFGFISNDTLLDLEANRLLLITGPNMAGKSTYLRQVALIVLMAQMGSFVPAREATIGLVDRIFTRVGASDNLAGGQSTFMVEMTETAQILASATGRSLILLDEIGRGTSTYDGLSIAWAVAEHIQDRRQVGARTLFATHYHEMTQLADLRDGIRNFSVSVQERNGEVLFLRKIVAGGADRSYGIHVARLAGLPARVIGRAQEVLRQLESATGGRAAPPSAGADSDSLPPPHPIIEEVRQMDLFSMTPLEALNRLAALQKRLDELEPRAQ